LGSVPKNKQAGLISGKGKQKSVEIAWSSKKPIVNDSNNKGKSKGNEFEFEIMGN